MDLLLCEERPSLNVGVRLREREAAVGVGAKARAEVEPVALVVVHETALRVVWTGRDETVVVRCVTGLVAGEPYDVLQFAHGGHVLLDDAIVVQHEFSADRQLVRNDCLAHVVA